MNNKKFTLGKAPFIRKADLTNQTTTSFMRDLVIALIPLILFGWVKNGLLPFLDDNTNFWGMIYPLLLPILGGAFSFILEFLWYKFIINDKPIAERMSTSYAIIPGLMLGMIVSVSTPIWVLFLGTIFATVIAKLLFGGFGNNIFNPALIGFLFITTAYMGLVGSETGFGSIGFLNPSEAKVTTEIISGATPMTALKSSQFSSIFAGYEFLMEEYGLLKMFLGFTPGAVAETSALLCLVGLIYLLIRKVINWRIPVIYLGTVFVLTYIIGAFNGYAGTLDFALFGLLNGGLMFGAVFMATEPVTSPRNPNGKIIYAIALGVITIVFRFASNLPEGVAVAILVMNMFTAIIERFASKLRVETNKKKVVLSYSLIGLLLLGIGTFPVVKSFPKEDETPDLPVFEYVEKEQDYQTFDFVYTFTADGEEFTVRTKQDHKIASISKSEFAEDDLAKEALAELIKGNRFSDFMISAEETLDNLILVVSTKGYGSQITSTITYTNDYTITDFKTEYTETYEYGSWEEENGNPKDILPNKIIENQSDLSQVEVISGATVTSNAIIRSVDVAKNYLDYLDNLTELLLVGQEQDLNTLELVYLFRNSAGKFLVKTDFEYEILSDLDEALEVEVTGIISKNKFENYIKSAEESTLVVVTKGFNGPITSTITYDSEFKITEFSVNYNETYEYGSWKSENGNPKDVIPNRIIENQNDLSQVEVISGATVTSNSILKAAEMALEYLENLEGVNEK